MRRNYAQIEYEIEFLNPKFADLYGRLTGSISGARLKAPYAEIRKSLGAFIRDRQESNGVATGGAVPKFRFLVLVVNGVPIDTKKFPFGPETEPSGKLSRTA